jgi:hypothetical protein
MRLGSSPTLQPPEDLRVTLSNLASWFPERKLVAGDARAPDPGDICDVLLRESGALPKVSTDRGRGEVTAPSLRGSLECLFDADHGNRPFDDMSVQSLGNLPGTTMFPVEARTLNRLNGGRL